MLVVSYTLFKICGTKKENKRYSTIQKIIYIHKIVVIFSKNNIICESYIFSMMIALIAVLVAPRIRKNL